MWAHSGIVGAADAILIDLEANGILKALLEAQETTPEEQAAERYASAVLKSNRDVFEANMKQFMWEAASHIAK